MAGTEKKRAGWAGWAAAALAALGALALGYMLLQAASKPGPNFLKREAPAPAGYARFAQGSLAKLLVLEEPPPAPTQPIYDAAGEMLTLAALPGKVKLVNLWATWCIPCLTELPSLAALQREYAAQGLAVVAINIEPPAKLERATEMLARLGEGALAFHSDPSLELPLQLATPEQPIGLPITVLYGADGREKARILGGADWAGPEAKALIEQALQDVG